MSNRSRDVVPADRAKPPARAGAGAIPVLGDLLATYRMLRDREAPIWAKVLVVAAFAYVLWPLDAVPDLVPWFGWLDDAGLVIVARIILARRLSAYRYALRGKRAREATSS